MTNPAPMEHQLKALAHEEAQALEDGLFWSRLQTSLGHSMAASAGATSASPNPPISRSPHWRFLAALAAVCVLMVLLWVTLALFEGASAHWAEALGGGGNTGWPHQPFATDSSAWTRALAEHLAGLTLCAWLAACVWWLARIPLWPIQRGMANAKKPA